MLGLLLPAIVAIAAGSPVGQGPAIAPTPLAVPFTIDEIFGARPVVDATIKGTRYRLVLHANAGSYLQINHADAAQVGAHDLKHRNGYGISAPGQVSDLGRDDGPVDDLAIGAWRKATVPVAVFEVPAGGSQGMLGLPFLHDSRAVIDFGRRQLLLPGEAEAASLACDVAGRGYVAVPMIRDPADGRDLVDVTIDGVKAPMVVSAVAGVDLDTVFAASAKVGTGKAVGTYGGPSGATGTVYRTAKPVTFRLGSWSSEPMVVSIEDTYAYSRTARPADGAMARGGASGADFMIATEAVIDFGNAVLYLKN